MHERVASRWIRRILAGSKVLYVAIFLTPPARDRLLDRYGQAHSNLYAHHMTLRHRQDGEALSLDDLPLGKKVLLRVVGYAEDAKGQVVVVEPPVGLRATGRVPHITLSTAPGVGPVYSNTLIREGVTRQSGVPAVVGVVGWWDGKQARYDRP